MNIKGHHALIDTFNDFGGWTIEFQPRFPLLKRHCLFLEINNQKSAELFVRCATCMCLGNSILTSICLALLPQVLNNAPRYVVIILPHVLLREFYPILISNICNAHVVNPT